MKELITRVEELAVQASRDARQIETLQGLLKASQSDLMAELTDAIERKKKIDQLASENAALIVSECGHKKAAREAQEKYEESHRLHSLAVEARNKSALGVELAGCYEDLRVRNVKQEQELEELRAFAKADNKRHGDLRDEMTAVCRLAGSFGMRGDESLAQFMDRICGNKVVALEGSVALLNAKVGPLEKLYIRMNDYCRENSVRENADSIYHQVAAAKAEIDRLTA
jgi:hypothetical protein